MREMINQRVPVMTRTGPKRLADGQGLTTALGAIAVFPAIACALTFLLRDPRRAVRADEIPGPISSTHE